MPDIRGLITGKTVRFILITVVLGAVGSGAWEWLLKPSLVGLSEFGLNVATLGIQSFKNSLYRNIAQGLHEEASVSLFTLASIVPSFLFGMFIATVRPLKFSENGGKGGTGMRRARMFVGAALFFMFTFISIQANQLGYVNRAVTHVQQLFAIVDPYISPTDRLLFRSQFSQISSSEDYEKLTAALLGICKEHRLKAPEFVVW